MGRRRAGSPLIREVERAINEINQIGVSKRDAHAAILGIPLIEYQA